MSWKALLGAAFGMALIFGVQGCSDDDDNTLAGPPAGSAEVRVAHLSPDAGLVDVWVNDAVEVANVPFRAFSDYLPLTTGTYRIRVTPAGQTAPVVIDANVALEDGKSYTVFARGLLSDSSINATVLEDDRATSAQAKVRFVHSSPDADPVDITLTDGTILFAAIPFTEASTLPVNAGSYDLQVRAAGTDTVVLTFADLALAGSTNYTVWAVGLVNDGSLDAIVSLESAETGDAIVDLTPATASVRVGHLSPDAPPVDIWVDGAITGLTNVPFETVSGYLQLSAKTTNVQVFLAGQSTNPVITADVTLLPNEAYTIAATGLAFGTPAIGATLFVDDRTPPAAGKTKVRFIHASPDAPAVDVDVAGGGTLFAGTSFRGASIYQEVDAGTYDLEVLLSSNRSLALELPDVPLDAGTIATIFAVGLAGDATLGAVQEVDTP